MEFEEIKIKEEILAQNIKRLIFFSLLTIPVTLSHIIYFYNKLPQSGSAEYTWMSGIILSHLSILCLALLIGGIGFLHQQKGFFSSGMMNFLIHFFILSIIFIATGIVVIDQLVTSAITPFIVVCTLAAVAFLIHPRIAFTYFLIAFLLFVFLMPLTQSNPDFLLSNRVNGLTAVSMGFVLSLIIWKNTNQRYKQAIIIQNQKKDLELRNHELLVQSEELKGAISTKDKFFSIIAHDLKSPFNSIIGFSEILKDEATDLNSEVVAQYAGTINSTATNTYNLLVELLDWAKTQQGGMPFDCKVVVLDQIIISVFAGLKNSADQKNIVLTKNIPANLMMTADENMVNAILRNLIQNAIKFTPKSGKVNVAAKVLDKQVEISVSDNGIGMTREAIENLFKIETSFTTQGTENEKGTGLGLLLCKEFVEKHDGRIWVESEVGKGSTFRINLPVEIPESYES